MSLVSIDENFSLPIIGLGAFTYDNHEITTNIFIHYLKYYGKVIEISELFTNFHCLNQALQTLQLNRHDIYIIFKVWPQDQNPDELFQRLQSFLQLSQWEYFDIVFIHAPINLTYRYEQWKALENLKNLDLVKAIGTTNMSLNQLMTVMKNADLLPTVFSVEISPFLQQRDLSDYCDASSITMINVESNCKGVKNHHPYLIDIARSLNLSVEELLFRWSVSKKYVTLISPSLHGIFFPSIVSRGKAKDNRNNSGAQYNRFGSNARNHFVQTNVNSNGLVNWERWQEPLPRDILRQLEELDEEYLTTWAPIVEEDS